MLYLRILGEYWMCVLGNVSLSILWRILSEHWMRVFGRVSLSAFLGGYWVGIACIYWVSFVACFMMCIGCMYLVMFR